MREFDNNEDLPRIEGEYHPNFEEVLARIQNGTLSEIAADTDGGELILIDRRPRTEDEMWVDDEGRIVSSFMRKFRKGFEGWRQGEVVNARFTLRYNEGEARLMVADSYVGDSRHADTFVLTEISEEEEKILKKLGMATIDADVEVRGLGEYRISNMFDYEAHINCINAIQLPWDGERALQIDEQVLVEGKVVDYKAGESDYSNAQFPLVHIRLASGQVVPIEMTSGRINYDGGNLDFLYPQGLQIGDVVQINSTFSNASTLADHKGRPPSLHASRHRTAFLLQPSLERLVVYEAQRADIAARFTELQSLEGRAFYHAYAQCMQAYIELREATGELSRLLLTEEEKSALETLIDQKFPDDLQGNPSPARPLTNFRNVEEMCAVNRGYGVDVYMMSHQEFYDFCLDVANGRSIVDLSAGVGAGECPFRILGNKDEKFSAHEQFEVYRQSVEFWTSDIKDKELVEEDVLTHSSHATYEHKRLAEQSIVFLGELGKSLPAAKEYLYTFTIQTLQERLTEVVAEKSFRAADSKIVYTLCSELDSVLSDSIAWERDGSCIGVNNPQGLNYFVERLSELAHIAQQLKAIGNERDARQVRRLIARITEFNSLPPCTDE